ncbi:MAG TPA: hypothetical protein VNT42_04645 [Sphingomonas sp.]|nr:hypothetical protein [Sphingomonas sp.]
MHIQFATNAARSSRAQTTVPTPTSIRPPHPASPLSRNELRRIVAEMLG